ncbi:hypothetical protein GCM10007242_16880 [Pigmentiphaga litoralis]|uniref:hypothetical protein n=1 Tax=Pigmentiphaga litoralis TaxID=516702 RepID=UPI0016794B2C|nr:hypothetical protein [Pigmentiphaga litoralis]GGX11382.1 hypothetical protein GCM10007242_16880 [Pigmentiphaga litoralis]
MDKQRKGYEWWDRLCKLPKFSFIIKADGVRRVEDSTGNWIEYASAQAVIDDAQAEINTLRERLDRLAPAAAPEPATASDERERTQMECAAFRMWWDANQECPEHSLTTQNAAHAAWQARAALATLPGVEAAEQKPVAFRVLEKAPDGTWQESANWRDGAPVPGLTETVRRNPDYWRIELAYATPSPAASSLDPHPPTRHCMCADCKPSFEPDHTRWVTEAVLLVEGYVYTCVRYAKGAGPGMAMRAARAALIGHLEKIGGANG